MAKKASPWFWEARDGWYVLLNGQRHFLGEHPIDAPRPQKSKKTGKWNSPQSIDEAFHRLLHGGTPQSLMNSDGVAAVLDDFITWAKENRAGITAQRYEEFCQSFINADEGGVLFGSLPASALSGRHVTAWLNRQEAWGPTTKKNAITALIRAFNWAVKNRGLPTNPIRGMEKPEARRQATIVTPEEFEKVLEAASGPFADLLTVSYDSGARPFEVKDLEKRHVEMDKRRAVIPATETKGRRNTRVFYFPTDRSAETVRRLCEERPIGPLFLNNRGNKWTGDAVKCSFARLEKVVGRRIKHYDFRRTFVTRKIIAGVDSHVVAKLSGHQSTAMIDRHYSAVANDHEFMLRMAAQDIKPQDEKATNPTSDS
jgi:integrase